MMNKESLKTFAFGLLVITFILGGLTIATDAREPFVDCGKVVHGAHQEIRTMDPAEAFVVYSCQVVRAAYEGLLKYNLKDLSLEPLLAESWEIDENGGTFHLRKGVKFHDGTDFNAEAVRFNWQRIMAINKGPATWVKDIKDVKVIDSHTVRIETQKNWAFLLDVLASHRCFLVASPTAVKKHATKEDPWATKWFHGHTCGTGPYMSKEWVPNQYVTMVRFKDYWRGWSGKHFSEVVYKLVPEVATRSMLLKTGEVDLVTHMPPELSDELDAYPDIVTEIFPSFSQYMILMNNARGPLTDKNLRLAITYAFDYETYRKAIKAPPGLLIGSVQKQDLKKAMDYKNKSAYAGKEVDLVITYVVKAIAHKHVVLVLQENLKKIGINLKAKGVTYPPMAKEVYGNPKEAGDMYSVYMTSIIADPYGLLYKILHSNSTKPGGPNLGYTNPKFDALLDRARTTIDRKKRMALYEGAKKLAVDDAAYVWTCLRPNKVMHRADVKPHPDSTFKDGLGNILYFYDMYRE